MIELLVILALALAFFYLFLGLSYAFIILFMPFILFALCCKIADKLGIKGFWKFCFSIVVTVIGLGILH